MVVRTDTGVLRRPVGRSALERGVLVGRYSRCDVGVRAQEDSRLSRVHLLIVRDGDEVFWGDLPEIWEKVAHKRAFMDYVQANVSAGLDRGPRAERFRQRPEDVEGE